MQSRVKKLDKIEKLGLKEALNMEDYFLDSTCLKANVHFPTDWVLLRDGVRTLMKATLLIRRAGLRGRMEAPEAFLGRMNRLAMEMSQQARRAGTKKGRKRVLRQMKRLVGVVPARRTMSPIGGGATGVLTETDESMGAEAYMLQNIRDLDTARAVLGEGTFFLTTSDHGAQWPFAKWNLYESGVAVPLIVSWPGVVKPGTRAARISKRFASLPGTRPASSVAMI